MSEIDVEKGIYSKRQRGPIKPLPPDDPLFKQPLSLVSINKFKRSTKGTAEAIAEETQTFDPAAMEAEAKRMLQNGTMPSKEQLEAALAGLRKEFGPKILRAREQDQLENSSKEEE